MKTCIFILLTCVISPAQSLFFGTSEPYTILQNVDDITTQTLSSPPGWQKCIEPSCNPGGNAAGPTSFVQTFSIGSPSRDGASMQFSMVAPAQTNGTNALYTYKIVGNPTADSVTHMVMDLWVYCDTNCGLYIKQLEFDQGIFCVTACVYTNTPNGTNYMFGSQCNLAAGVFQVWNQAAGAWVTATYSGGNIPCTSSNFTTNTWHHLTETVHKVAGDTNSCTYSATTYPQDYYDNITIDNNSYTPTNTQLCAGNLPGGYSSVIFVQQQINIGASGSSSNTASTYYDDQVESYY